MKKSPRVAILVETSSSYGRGVLRGVLAYVRKQGPSNPWTIYLSEKGQGEIPPWLETWNGDGMIVRVDTPEMQDLVTKTGLPAVDISATRAERAVPCVEPDDVFTARLAAKHLLSCGFKYFGFCGDNRYQWSANRCEPFVRVIREAGFVCSAFQGEHGGDQAQRSTFDDEQELAEWLRSLPKPAGIMACNDFRGWQVLEICRRIGIAVPDEVAVIGVDNDELLCALSTPPLSSVELDTFRTGYEAAKILDQWMLGKRPNRLLRVKPLGVVTRQSSDIFAVSDSEVSLAVRFIRDHACEGIKVEDVLKQVPLSRRMLEHRFKRLLGRTPHDEIVRVQFQHVLELLTETDLPMTEVAERSGFRYAEYLSAAFKRRFGVPPKKYREKHSH